MGMWVCKECFTDVEICKEVENNSTDEGKCDVCGRIGKRCDLSVFADFFVSVIQLFKRDDTSQDTIISLLEKDWNIFADDQCARIILSEVIHTNGLAVNLNDMVTYTDAIINGSSVWEQLKAEVKESYRFFVDHDKFDDYAGLLLASTLREGTLLFRARVTPDGQKKLKAKNMGCPEKGKATAGRANPLGIPYLYLCKEEQTTYYEVRSVFLDRLSIGKFRIQRDLKIVDFNSKSSLFLSFDGANSLSDTVVKKLIQDAISHDLSKPLRRYDTELEYIPTQLICEYCKRNNADGICFNSSLHSGGVNYVLFNPDDAKCISVISREIKSIYMGIR